MHKKKSTVLLVVGALMSASIFGIIPFSYPNTGPSLSPHIFINQNNSSLLGQYEGSQNGTLGGSVIGHSKASYLGLLEGILLDVEHFFLSLFHFVIGSHSSPAQSTGFSPKSRGPVLIHGYIRSFDRNNTSIANSLLTVSVLDAYTSVMTNSSGCYYFSMVDQGKGTLSYFIYGYKPDLVTIDTDGLSSEWTNVSLREAQKYQVSGLIELTNGTPLPFVNINFENILGGTNTSSQYNGDYSITIPNGTYIILVSKTGMNSTPAPDILVVAGQSIKNFDLKLKPSGKMDITVSGYVFNREKEPVSDATVLFYSGNVSVNTDSNGHYIIYVSYGLDNLVAYDYAYGSNSTTVYVRGNLTDVNFTLTNKNPLGGGTVPTDQNNTFLNNSNINYSQIKENLTLQGNITSSLGNVPVSGVSFTFYTKVNGTVFEDSTTTNATGHYLVNILYPGKYFFEVTSSLYHNYFFNTTIIGNSTYNFTVIPLSGQVYLISGYIKAQFSEAPLSGASVGLLNLVGIPDAVNYSNGQGFYKIYAVNGTYKIEAYAFGFNQSSPFNIILDRNYTDFNITLNISFYQGNGIVRLGGNFQSGLPWINGILVGEQLGASSGNSYASGSGPLNVTFHLENETGSLSRVPFILYIEIDRQRYMDVSETNNTGNFTLRIDVAGNFSILVDTLYNKGNVTVINAQHTSHTILILKRVQVYRDVIELTNSYRYAYPNDSIPENYLNETSSLLPIGYSSFSVRLNTTTFNYSLPEGNYTFRYSNVHFVEKNFTSNWTHSNTSKKLFISPYLIHFNARSYSDWYYNISSQNSSSSVPEPSGNQNLSIREISGKYEIEVGLILGKNYTQTNKTLITLSPVQSIFTGNLSIANYTYSINSTNDNMSVRSSGQYINISGTMGLQISDYIYSASLSFNTSNVNISQLSFYFGGEQIPVRIANGVIEMNNYLKVSSHQESFNISILERSKNFEIHFPVILYANYVKVSLQGSYS